jgi:hypothetical protein
MVAQFAELSVHHLNNTVSTKLNRLIQFRMYEEAICFLGYVQKA